MTIARRLLAALSALLVAAPVFAQAQRIYSQPELDQMLAPIALYPDPLLSQVLMAATYPLEIAEAARWSRAYPGLQGDDAVRAAQNEDWDPSVKSLLALPQVLARMDENPDWTRSLGEAFLAQEPYVMDTVQQLRQRAQAAGNLQSSRQIYVQQQGQAILVQPADPQYLYVPYYDPRLVYGPWWWPAYQPLIWAPRPGYARAYRPGVHVSVWWGAPVRWQHDPTHRRTVIYRDPRVARRFAAFQPRRPEQLRRAAPPQAQQPQVRHDQRPPMPAAVAPQHPRAEHREPRHEQRNERGDKGRGRS